MAEYTPFDDWVRDPTDQDCRQDEPPDNWEEPGYSIYPPFPDDPFDPWGVGEDDNPNPPVRG